MSLELSIALTLEVRCTSVIKEASQSVATTAPHPHPSLVGQQRGKSRKRRREGAENVDSHTQTPLLKQTIVEHFWVEKKALPPHLAAAPDIRQLPIEAQTAIASIWVDQRRLFQTTGGEVRQSLASVHQRQKVRRTEWSGKGWGASGTWTGEESATGDTIPVDCEVQASCTEGISIG